jgi:hypothetical protein
MNEPEMSSANLSPMRARRWRLFHTTSFAEYFWHSFGKYGKDHRFDTGLTTRQRQAHLLKNQCVGAILPGFSE